VVGEFDDSALLKAFDEAGICSNDRNLFSLDRVAQLNYQVKAGMLRT